MILFDNSGPISGKVSICALVARFMLSTLKEEEMKGLISFFKMRTTLRKRRIIIRKKAITCSSLLK
jgi:hypothetical protein